MSRREIGPSKLIEDPEEESNFTAILDNRIAALEERLNACDSFFRLTSQNSKIQEKQRKNLAKSIASDITKLEQDELHITDQLASVQRMIKDAVASKAQKIEQNATEMYTLVKTIVGKKMADIETKFTENNEQTNLLIDEISSEVDQLRNDKDSGARIAEMLTILEGLQSQQLALASHLG